MSDKIQGFNPNVVDEIRTVFDAGKEIDRIDNDEEAANKRLEEIVEMLNACETPLFEEVKD